MKDTDLIITPDDAENEHPEDGMDDAAFQELLRGIEEIAATRSAQPSILRRTVYDDHVMVRIEEGGAVSWDLSDAAATLGQSVRTGETVLPDDPIALLNLLKTGLRQSQPGLAHLLGIPLATLRNWMQGRRTPDAGSVKLLRLALMHPEALLLDAGLSQAA